MKMIVNLPDTASEHEIQKAAMQYLALKAVNNPQYQNIFAVPNEMRSGNPVHGKRANNEGRKKGVPDILILVAAGGYHGAAIEVKTKKGKLSDEQKDWLTRLSDAGYFCAVCRSVTAITTCADRYIEGDLIRGSK